MPGPSVIRSNDQHAGICSHGLPCCPHAVIGVYVAGAKAVTAHGPAVVRVGDTLIHNCPHCGVGIAATGSATVKVEGAALHRSGDLVTYPGGSGVALSGDPLFTSI